MKRLWTLLFVILSFCGVICAQNSITFKYNSLRSDSLNKEIIPPIDAGCEGENVTWDFTAINVDNTPDTTSVNLYISQDKFLWDDCGSMTTYRQLRDSLLIIREENPICEMDFDIPPVKMTYPFYYGSNISSPYSGHGKYEDKFQITESGKSQITGDAYGTLILADGDTLRNVLRVHTATSSNLDVRELSTKNYVCTMRKTSNTYEWYARGYRYPVLKTETNTVESGEVIIFHDVSSQRITPDMQKVSYDENNEELRAAESHQGILSYSVTVNSSSALVTYDLQEDAQMCMTLADSRGIVYWRYEADMSAGQGYQTSVPLSGLLRGQYVIYINVNGEIDSCKVNID